MYILLSVFKMLVPNYRVNSSHKNKKKNPYKYMSGVFLFSLQNNIQ